MANIQPSRPQALSINHMYCHQNMKSDPDIRHGQTLIYKTGSCSLRWLLTSEAKYTVSSCMTRNCYEGDIYSW